MGQRDGGRGYKGHKNNLIPFFGGEALAGVAQGSVQEGLAMGKTS